MKSQFETLMENPEFRKNLAAESLLLEATEMVSRLMEEQAVSKAELARRLGKSRAWVTQLLDGSANMTLRTLAEVLVTLDAEARMESKPAAWNTQKQTTATKPVQFLMDKQLIQTLRAEDLYRIEDRVDEQDAELATGIGADDDQRPEYAA